jgi:hypothetical protein
MKMARIASIFVTLFSLLIMQAHSQDPNKKYDDAWKKVDAQVQKGLPKSALTEVKSIYAIAKKEKQDAQLIRSLVYMVNLQAQTREDHEVLSIAEIEKEIAGSREPAKSILNSLLAELYWKYYQRVRWNLYNRTNTAEFKKDDITTWGTDDFHQKIGALYLASVKDEKLLQQTRLDAFSPIIVKGNMRPLRPTLFDLLAHRALDYFQLDGRNIRKPAYAFGIDLASAFDPAADFVHRKFNTRDSLSLEHKALLMYQKLISFHLSDRNPEALIDADLSRIQFVKNKSTHPDKDPLYFNAINHIAHQYESTPAAAQAWYLLAAYYEEKAATYQPGKDTTHRYARLKAKEICEKVLTQKDESEGKINCYNLLHSLQAKSMHFNIEKVNVPAKPFRALIEYRNFTKLYLRIIQPAETLKKQLEERYDNQYWKNLLAAKPIRTWDQALPETGDLQQHRTEIRIDGLQPGEYILIASTDQDFNNEKAMIGARVFYVSNISFVENDDDFFVLNRDSGQPLMNATIQVWEQQYDYKQSKYIKKAGKSYQADTNGFFRKDKRNDEPGKRYSSDAYMLDITYKGDRLFMDDMIIDYYYYNNDEDRQAAHSIFLFSDRSLYRPGQTLYFKGIVFTKTEGKQVTAHENFETTVYLRDANYQDIDSVKIRTNEFGSINGKFQLPSSGLNGDFSIYTKQPDGAVSFRVEEYKRPKFFVDYDTLKGSYRLGEEIAVTGFAKAYAGNNIDGANVKYRVVRQPRFIYPWLTWRWWMPPTPPMEIAHGEAVTDKEGKFRVKFTAIPDASIDKKLEPVFDYTVYADITDINGETRSGEQRITVGYKALLLKTNIPSKSSTDSIPSFYIRTENMNGAFEPADVKVTITQLNPEQRLIRSRLWERPDQFVMSREEYIRHFPNDEYDRETDPANWSKGKVVFEKTNPVNERGEWKITETRLPQGYYEVAITTSDKNGGEVKDLRYIEIYDEKSKQLAFPQYLWTDAAKPIEPGEQATVKLGSTADNLFLVHQISKNIDVNKIRSAKETYSFLKMNNEKHAYQFSATESDRGGYGVGWLFIKHNRVYQYDQTITVPWTNKDLNISYATYRDKTLPGSEEKWTLKISGYKNEKFAAELLASMYDASLDQFYPHQWNKPGLWPHYYQSGRWNSHSNFAVSESMLRPVSYFTPKYFEKQYDKLLSFDDEVVVAGYATKAKRGEGSRELKEVALANAAPVAAEMSLGDTVDTTSAQKEEDEQGKSATNRDASSGVRKNFNETAFFLPVLRTDSTGNIEFSFTMPEALTRWKFQALAHTKEGALGYSQKEIVTQKELMVQPNAPRFLREGDKMDFSAKIVNLSTKELTGQAELQLLDATTNLPVDGWFGNMAPSQFFTVAPGQSEAVLFPVTVPYQFNKAFVWRVVAKAENFSDGEESALPVLTNRMLVTESFPLPLNGTGTKDFQFDKLLKSGESESLQQHALTVEYTSNPAWYAIQSLPYLMEYPYDCAEQTWNRYYANTLAGFIANSSPRIRQVFESWKTKDTAALLSNLEKNEALKSILLEETPWVLQAKTEAEQKKNMALLFDLVKMSASLNESYNKLVQMQSSNGGFVWFKGGPDDRYMTQYIIAGIGHLKKLAAYEGEQKSQLDYIVKLALPYLDKKIKEDYDNLVKSKAVLTKYTPGYTAIDYLYMRSFFPEQAIPAASKKAYDYFKGRAQATWMQQNKYMQGMLALALGRSGDHKTASSILKSLKETAIVHEELGMYWKDARRGWFWYEAPIERQALMIEAFQEIGKDLQTADKLRTWLLKNKQTNNWESTKATAEACYALLLQGTNWLNAEPRITIKLGNTTISQLANTSEAGSGYFKQTIEAKSVKPEMGNIHVNIVADSGTVAQTWGAVYWQYFEDLDKITTSSTPLKLVKKLFIEKNTDRGPVLTPVAEGDALKVGDKIKVRIELRVDRDMEYVHMKDMRASSLEPVNVLSSYKWQGGLGYYETTKDASTNFFFNHLRKGTYVFEYPLFTTHKGNFSNGITSIQCMYAPEFTAHSEGIRINVE